MSKAGQLQIVLVVDDTPENIGLLSGMLNPYYRVKAATSAVIRLCVAGISLTLIRPARCSLDGVIERVTSKMYLLNLQAAPGNCP